MSLHFIDGAENEGRIGEDFTIEYDGQERVEPYVEAIIEETTTDEAALEEIILDMIHALDIDEVRRE